MNCDALSIFSKESCELEDCSIMDIPCFSFYGAQNQSGIMSSTTMNSGMMNSGTDGTYPSSLKISDGAGSIIGQGAGNRDHASTQGSHSTRPSRSADLCRPDLSRGRSHEPDAYRTSRPCRLDSKTDSQTARQKQGPHHCGDLHANAQCPLQRKTGTHRTFPIFPQSN